MASDTSRSLHLWCSFVHKSVTVYPRSAPGARFSLTKQNKCVRSMFFAYGRDNATPSNSLLGILKFENVYKFKVALFTHKILNGSTNISTIFQRTLTRASEIHTHNTRFASKLNFQRPKQMTTMGLLLSLLFHLNLGKLFQQERLPYTSFFNQYKYTC